jgi:nicotinamidase-related amidase
MSSCGATEAAQVVSPGAGGGARGKRRAPGGQAGRSELVEQALAGRHPELVEPIAPREPVPFVTKGRHSILYQTAVDHLLRTRGVQRLVLAGQVAEQCILYSALDAYMRGYEMTVPADAVAHIDPELARAALTMMSRNVHANVSNAEALNLAS